MEQLLLPWINLFPPSILHPKRPFPTTSTQLHSNQFTRVNLAAGRTKVHKLRMAEGEKKNLIYVINGEGENLWEYIY